MSKKIIYCSDGTWATSKKEENKSMEVSNSNVQKMYRAVLHLPDQIAFYESGLGTQAKRWFRFLLSGSIGSGIDQKIKEAYFQISQAFKPGDELFFFGWSRGAYTIRSLANMICDVGLPTKPIDYKAVDELFFVYRNPDKRNHLLSSLQKKYNLEETTIKFIGVLDTVGSLGVEALHGDVSHRKYDFLETCLRPQILHAYQAIAIDECRQQFPITHWFPLYPSIKGQVLEEIYFSGCHDDVGGGYPEYEPGLSELPLKWMAKKVSDLGLQIDPALLPKHIAINTKQALSPIHETWKPMNGKRDYRIINDNAFLSESVAIRCKQDPTYRPPNLKFVDGKLSPSYQIVKILDTYSL